jgi:hypothetical protein
MIKKRNTRGQFYLLSAIVIISIIIGFSAISTYTKKTSNVRVFDLGEELDIESANVLDYGTYPENAAEVGNLDEFLKGFVSNYSGYLGEDTQVSFVFGNPDDTTATVVNYEEVTLGNIDYGSSQITSTKRVSSEESSQIQSVEGKKVTTIIFNGQEYQIELKPGENFYFVISQNVGEEVHTTTSKS